MTETENKPTADIAQTAGKKSRRGISNQTKAVSLLRFHEKDAAPNMLFVGHVEGISVDWSTNSEGKQFTGMSVPRITLHVTSNHTVPTEQRHVFYTINPVESNVLTIPGGTEEWKVNNVFNWIKHLLDIFYLKGRELTTEEEEALTLPFEDYDDNGAYVGAEPETVIAGYRFIFENAVAMLNGQFNLADGVVAKPTYKTQDGKFIPCWIKLLRCKKIKGQWKNVAQNGELGFDGFLGNGVLEIVKRDCPPTVLRVDLAKESITPKEVKQAPTIGIPGSTMAGLGGVMPISAVDTGAYTNSAFNDADAEMPF